MDGINYDIKYLKADIENDEEELLTAKDWKNIYEFRDSEQIIRTCGNSGSYIIYQTSALKLLSAKTIIEIPKYYEGFKRAGYF